MIYKVGDFRSEFDKLKEEFLIKRAFKFIAITTLISIVAMVNPYVYSIIPAAESEICLCFFYNP